MSTTFVSYLNAATGDSLVTGPVPIEPLDCDSGNVYPKMKDRINDTAWELWYFDGGTEDGKTAITISFFRDARGLRDGGFRTQIFAMWPDGTKRNIELFFAESIVTAEGYSPVQAEVHGVWKTVDDAASATFTVAANLSTATLNFSVPNKVSGTLEMRATSGSKAGLPSTEEEALLSPGMYYMRPISLAEVSVDLTFEMVPLPAESEGNEAPEQRKLIFQSGKGGIDRC
ncbi:hypothetical protein N7491_004701 [Penicillium cf. griseofulvum]|uniref:Diels-Alderase N-terminal domain-containing protein n=1 Tax=Penicillium cf. griseofulvum TaxID=2972120 RepID=A0A9W9J352_9EURO|nr:hypothetical protein N7472_007390 [Penicillium cf. griseofulvum]KAJ5434106.1 hypothetical protein N7491_004701 [Penicillium cf. griseofulvum]KAJ5451933.1 hypothetical protein N7445_000116 [Penicillium cf. griseofulvum]